MFPFLLAATIVAVSTAGAGATENASPATAVLDQAFRFASAIRSDDFDRASAQERVVLEYGTVGALDAAIRRADEVDGWQRGVAYAEIATMLAKGGRANKARALVKKAEVLRGTVTGWENPRIAAHVANALAALGVVEPAAEVAKEISVDRQYGGRAPATIAAAYAATGDFKRAMAELAPLADLKAPEDCVWRTQGYLAVARQQKFSRSNRLEALAAARRSAEAVPGWLNIEPLVEVAGEYRSIGKESTAREILEQAQSAAETIPATTPLCAPILSEVAREWARCGKADRARALLVRAEEIARATRDIGRPYIVANVAAGYKELGDGDAARRLLVLAFAEAQGQVNARPRAISIVEICRTMARYGMPMDDATKTTLDALYAGLKDPW